jgi:hypothetical protein
MLRAMKARVALPVLVLALATGPGAALASPKTANRGPDDYARRGHPLKPCRAGYVDYEDSRGRRRCHRRRSTRLWYRVGLEVTWNRTDQGGGVTNTQDQHWKWESDHAVVLYRQCTLPDTQVQQRALRVAGGFTPAVPCRLQHPELIEDVSWGATGHGDMDALRGSVVSDRPADLIADYFQGLAGHMRMPCGAPPREDTSLTEPLHFEANVATAGQSAAGGLSIAFPVGAPGSSRGGRALVTESAIECADPPPNTYAAVDPRRSGGSHEILVPWPERGPLQHAHLKGIADGFGDPRIKVSETVERPFGGAGGEKATYKLEFKRCPRGGRRAKGC